MLHSRVVEIIPSHGRPPEVGGGLLHLRVLVVFPPPHNSLHWDQSVQSPHPPFTVAVGLVTIVTIIVTISYNN